jgi:molecular chaperone GrpE
MAQNQNEEMEQEPLQDDETAAAEGQGQSEAHHGRPEDAAKREIADLKVKLARWQADFQNMQRRAAREVLEARQNADADFAKAMLQVLDHFDMALSVDPTKVDTKGLLDGVKITYDELKKVLANRGIESFDATGKPFDPHQHEAVMQEPSDKFPPMTVVQTFQQGYRIGDRVLRPAKVKVSK